MKAEASVFQPFEIDPAQSIEVSREGVVVQVMSTHEVIVIAANVTVNAKQILPETNTSGELGAVYFANRG